MATCGFCDFYVRTHQKYKRPTKSTKDPPKPKYFSKDPPKLNRPLCITFNCSPGRFATPGYNCGAFPPLLQPPLVAVSCCCWRDFVTAVATPVAQFRLWASELPPTPATTNPVPRLLKQVRCVPTGQPDARSYVACGATNEDLNVYLNAHIPYSGPEYDPTEVNARAS